MKSLPRVVPFQRTNTHRLVPSRYTESRDSVLTRIADDNQHLAVLFELDEATNDRNLGENGLVDGIGPDELLFGVPYYRTVNAAFLHPHPLGSRFNGPNRGAWYAALEIRTAQAEVAFHKTVELAEIDYFDESVTYDDHLADFSAQFHDIRNTSAFNNCLAPGSYRQSQALAVKLLEQESQGIVYPSVRRNGGTCLACFRPALVYNVRRGSRYRFSWSGTARPRISVDRSG